MAKEELMTLEGHIDEVMPDGRFGVTLDNEHRIIAYTAGKMRKFRIRSVVGDRVHVEMTPYDLSKGRIIFRERTPGRGPGRGAGRPEDRADNDAKASASRIRISMNVQNQGAPARPKLSLLFGAGPTPRPAANERRRATLSSHELRRIVAAMVD